MSNCRGKHWNEKISKGISIPTPWKLTRYWAVTSNIKLDISL